jgi:hemophore-related protein
MRMPANSLRRGLCGAYVICAIGGAIAVALPPASAAPDPCTASNLATTVSSVAGAAGQYLDAHPDADQALTSAGQQPSGADAAVKSYFLANPGEFLDLRGIARPLTDLKSQCNATVSPASITSLFQALD